MPTTTNNGWTTPADTDLVKNGAAAIRTLGNAIDSTLGVYSTPGLVKINTTTFSAVSSQSVNNVFTSTYQDYLILIDMISSVGAVAGTFKLRASGSDNSNSNYIHRGFGVSDASTYAVRGNAQTSFPFVYEIATSANFGSRYPLMVMSPQENSGTHFYYNGMYSTTTSSGEGHYFMGMHREAYQADGFTIAPASGTITGSVTTFGYKV